MYTLGNQKINLFETNTGDILYCDAIDDGYLCWPPTPAGNIAYQKCPKTRLSDSNNNAFRLCGVNGSWLDRKERDSGPPGWTNYTPCFPTDVRSLLTKLYNKEEDAPEKFIIAERTRVLEIIGFTLSLISLIWSLVIFAQFRSLRNNRTRIHQNLFTAMMAQVVVRLVLYMDQFLARGSFADGVAIDSIHSIENMPYLCIASYIMLEYAGTVMFMWMFLEGLYLHTVVTGNTLSESMSLGMYYILGWGLPVIITGAWAVMTHMHYHQETTCWYGYNFQKLYWIVQGPRLAVILVNFVFLLNIMRVLIMKLRQSDDTDLVKAQKAVRAALVLLPLLGITNILNMIEPPLESVMWFRIWSYSTHFFRSFQGLFIAVIYCFMNGEVRAVIRKYFDDKRAMRTTARPRGSNVSQRSRSRLCCGCSCDSTRSEDVEMQVIPPRPTTPHPVRRCLVQPDILDLPITHQRPFIQYQVPVTAQAARLAHHLDMDKRIYLYKPIIKEQRLRAFTY